MHMSNTFYGVIVLLFQIAAMVVGFIGIAQYSLNAALIYAAGIPATFVIFVYAYCTKCPIRNNCVHVVHGLVANLMPGREQGKYSWADILGAMTFFGFVCIFPQYWLLKNLTLLVMFWVIYLTGMSLNAIKLCHGCGNVDCILRR